MYEISLVVLFQLEEMYKKAHSAIRADPEAKPKPEKKVEQKR
jgi:hypothetical protein